MRLVARRKKERARHIEHGNFAVEVGVSLPAAPVGSPPSGGIVLSRRKPSSRIDRLKILILTLAETWSIPDQKLRRTVRRRVRQLLREVGPNDRAALEHWLRVQVDGSAFIPVGSDARKIFGRQQLAFQAVLDLLGMVD